MALAILMLLTLLFWQVCHEYLQAQAHLRQHAEASSRVTAAQLEARMAFAARAASAMLQRSLAPQAAATPALPLENLRVLFPDLQELIWLDANGRAQGGEGPPKDRQPLADLARGSGQASYRFAFDPRGEQLYLLLARGDAGQWALRLGPRALDAWLPDTPTDAQGWVLEDSSGRRLLPQRGEPLPGDAAAPGAATRLPAIALAGSDWQLRGLYDEARARARILAELGGKLVLYGLCALLALLVLYRLLREQQGLHALNAASRDSLRQTGSALGAIEERVLVSDLEGRLSYLNPQAEALFEAGEVPVRERHLLDLLPDLDPQRLREPNTGQIGDLVSLVEAGRRRLFTVTRSTLSEGERPLGYAWVLRDVTEEQQSLQVLRETRRRYQNIFEDSGVALCVLDLVPLHDHLMHLGLRNADDLAEWLGKHPQRHGELLRRLRMTEANQVALRLLEVSEIDQAWECLINRTKLRIGGVRFQLIAALFGGQQLVELETRILTAKGQERHLWLVLRLPEAGEDLHAVTLSLSDITARKHVELSLIERERFWSDVARAVPDTLYVHAVNDQHVLFSNNRLGPDLGYDWEELNTLGDRLWERILHPDDAELYRRMLNLQQVIGDGQLLQYQLRLRHRNGRWHWFDIREQALSRDARGRVSRLIGVAKDITDQIEASESLRESERRYRLLAESISDVIFTSDRQLQLNYVSPSVQPVLGYSSDWIIANNFIGTAANPRQLNGLFVLLERVRNALGDPQRLADLRRGLGPQLFLFDCLRADGRKIPVELRIMLMWDEHGSFEGILGVGRDISQQRRAEKDLRMAATVFEHSTAAILVTDPAGYIVQVNEAFSRITGYGSAEVLDQQPTLLTADRQQANHLNYIMSQLNQRGSWEGEVWLKRRQGDTYPSWVGITAVHDDEGDLVSYVCFFSDISERKASEQRIHRLAYYDALTHLPNRTLFQDRLHTALQYAERNQEWVVLMFLDLDRFKPINDSLGHAAGDRMLKDVALRLTDCVADDDTVARMGGDEFTLLLQPRSSREGALNRAIHVAEQILASLARPFVLEGREFFVTASIGIALSPQDGRELSQLMKNADTAMYHAKERGKNNFQFYQTDMNARALERLELESDLRHALEGGEFMLYYQPQFSGNGKRLTGVEALLRWRHPARGLVPPTEFIPVLEELGLVVQVGDWVLAEACRQMAAWHAAKVRVPKISVNLSARQFADGQLGARIAATLERSGIPPACLELELTESILMRDVGETLQILVGLKRLGLCVAVDDFGTGYSSLNYLKQFPIDVLKIDRSFVDGLPHGEQDAQIARAIIAMAHSLNLSVIAEGVETQAQLDFLREHDCDEVQGYLFGRPMPARQLEAQFSGTALFVLN
ncbi:EAL domain-containing protein [Pseudomonas sp. RIT-PI-AD]|uniref:EAL domain-containing protein n=1 Tax=Pseudomonas sp. RIT-PI-AD TaxID=3035294 RepID=UPI0021DB3A69|nr:EAL domain-containing protein [Pseudomonas sp. RIT-PI-AD]